MAVGCINGVFLIRKCMAVPTSRKKVAIIMSDHIAEVAVRRGSTVVRIKKNTNQWKTTAIQYYTAILLVRINIPSYPKTAKEQANV